MRILPNNNATFMVLYIYCGLVLENNDLIYRIVLLIYRTKVLNLSINQNFTLFIMNNTIDFHQRSIWILKTKGPQPLCALAEELKVTMEGARFQLLKLEKEGLVTFSTLSEGRGRPKQIWSLTDAGHAHFPDTHPELTVRLIEKMREIFGEKGVRAIVEANATDGIKKYTAELQDITDPEQRIARLAQIRDQEGYMAEYVKDGEGFLLIENHCPICAAATACQG